MTPSHVDSVDKEEKSGFVSSDPPQCSVYFEPGEWSRRYAETFFTAEVNGYQLQSDGSVNYQIRCRCGELNQWIVEHRYSDFESFSSQVQQQYQQSSAAASSLSNSPFPSLPPKTWFHSVDPSFLQSRQQSLQQFLNDLLQRREICRTPAVRSFLELDRSLRFPTMEETEVEAEAEETSKEEENQQQSNTAESKG